MYNPSLRREPRYEPAAVLAVTREETLINWLERNNRVIYRDKTKEEKANVSEEDIDITELMDGDDNNYEEEEEAL